MSLPNFLATLSPKQLFLIDGIGAIVSMLMLGIVLVKLEPLIGMPSHILYVLAAFAVLFALDSFSRYFFLKENRRPYLRFIAGVNCAYCVLTLSTVFYFWQDLTALGVFYFFAEILVILILAAIEWQVASK